MAQDFENGLEAYEAGDHAAALKEWQPLAEQGDADAPYNIGVMYEYGEGVLQDNAEAVKWYLLAAEQGDAQAQYNLGLIYYYGEGVFQDNIIAHMWFSIVSLNGHKPASKNRDIIASKMTSADIFEAQVMTRECLNSNHTNCGF